MNRKRLFWVLVATVILAGLLSGQVFAQQKKTGQKPSATGEPSKQDGKKIVGRTVNINKATAEEMVKSVPLLTPELAKKIVQYRKDNGDFQVIEELLQVEGMSRDLLKRIKPLLILEGLGGEACTC